MYAVGRRKTATARIRYYPNEKESLIVNQKDYRTYFPGEEFQKIITSPLVVTGKANTGSISVKVEGGGKRGQAESIRHGIAHAITRSDPSTRPVLRKYGFLTRDSRMKERKKYGLKGARRAPQWQKR